MEFARSVTKVQPFIEYDIDEHLKLLDALNILKEDKDKDVYEAVEQSDIILMSVKKKSKQ